MPARAVIDIGSHSVLLLAAERTAGQPRILAEEYRICALGSGLTGTGRIDPEAARRTLRVIEEYLLICRDLGVERVLLVGTSALREAQNRQSVLELLSGSGQRVVRVLGEREEAALTRLGALSGLDAGRDAAVFDLGGRSTELSWPGFLRSIPVGCQRGTEDSLATDPPRPAEIESLRAGVQEALAPLPPPPAGAALVVSGGTATTLASMDLGLSRYDPRRVHGRSMALARLQELVEELVSVPLAGRRKLAGIEPDRAGVLPAGGVILAELCRFGRRDSFRVSARGLTWGVWLEEC